MPDVEDGSADASSPAVTPPSGLCRLMPPGYETMKGSCLMLVGMDSIRLPKALEEDLVVSLGLPQRSPLPEGSSLAANETEEFLALPCSYLRI